MRAFTRKIDPLTAEEYLEVYLRGQAVLSDPMLNKGTAFTEDERVSLELEGIVRPNANTLEQQVARVMENFHRKGGPLDRFIYLQSLLDRNETLFYRVLCENLSAMLPIVYTPTVGEACLQMSHITRRFRGVYLDQGNIGQIDKIFQNIARPETSLIVVTDGERILGLGDLGSDGMPIPIGKINLYVAAGGIHPSCCLPVCLDVGTNNKALLDDPHVPGRAPPAPDGAGLRRLPRALRGRASSRNFPNALLQWEDFAKHTAFKLLERYRSRILSFNDDIQGTGAVALSTLISGMRIKKSRFSDERFLVVGVGQAGSGICFNIRAALREEGLSDDEARQRIFAVDMHGLLVEGMPNLEEPQKALRPAARRNGRLEARLSRPHRPPRRHPQREDHRPRRRHRQEGPVRREGAFGAGQELRAAHRVVAVESHLQVGVLARRCHPRDRRQRPLRLRQPVPRRDLERPHLPGLAVQQPLHLPGHGPRAVWSRARPRSPTACSSSRARRSRTSSARSSAPRACCCRTWRTSAR